MHIHVVKLTSIFKKTFLNFLTGSGKTAAFLIPMFERLKAHSAKVVFEFHIDKLNHHYIVYLFRGYNIIQYQYCRT